MRRIIDTPSGPALVEESDGIKISVKGATDHSTLNVNDAEWQKLHQQLKTGKLKFDKVKQEHGITGDAKSNG